MGVAPLGGFASVDDVLPLQEVTGATTGSSCVRFPHGAPSDRLQEVKDPDPALLIRLICYPVTENETKERSNQLRISHVEDFKRCINNPPGKSIILAYLPLLISYC